jgi:hypothetical protein
MHLHAFSFAYDSSGHQTINRLGAIKHVDSTKPRDQPPYRKRKIADLYSVEHILKRRSNGHTREVEWTKSSFKWIVVSNEKAAGRSKSHARPLKFAKLWQVQYNICYFKSMR